jgi:hypothetical protein
VAGGQPRRPARARRGVLRAAARGGASDGGWRPVFFTDWRGDADARLADGGPTAGELFRDAARRGMQVRGLPWRAHSDEARLDEEETAGSAS